MRVGLMPLLEYCAHPRTIADLEAVGYERTAVYTAVKARRLVNLNRLPAWGCERRAGGLFQVADVSLRASFLGDSVRESFIALNSVWRQAHVCSE